jgi:hypothetical protein
MAVRDDRPAYYTTQNVNAAISVATDRVRDAPFWQLDGSGVVVGLWDVASARATHQEFQRPEGGSRIHLGNTPVLSTHSTHVAGTIGAQGIDPAARGMAPAVKITSFNWDSDAAQMAALTASRPNQPDGIYVSNHSYGYIGGWIYLSDTSATGHTGWHWTAHWAGAQSRDDWFGFYHTIAGQWDDVAYTKNYYLAFAAAGNDRTDNPPLGATVYYFDNIWHSIVYDPNTCAPGDGVAEGGYDTLCGPAVAKNIMTVGAVGDAVADGTRSIADANMASFSSWGPTDDGRIKPDIVTNGINLYSTNSSADDSYATYSGTSMASPTATGSAALLVQLYGQLFPGQSMRSSTLKGLILHAADDLGQPGPDYQFGWGLMNLRAAAELIQKQHDLSSLGDTVVEGHLTYNGLPTNNPEDTYRLDADDTEPIRVTLCWTDPAGARLVHDLDLRLIGPDGTTTYYPYVLDPAKPSAIAATGDNHVDNVEQVYIGVPPETGTYTIRVNYKGTLAKTEQYYSLISSMPLSSQFPPTAKDVKVCTLTDTEIIITLSATDDGLPTPPPKTTPGLAYSIASLPKHGSLRYPYSSAITQPTRLVNKGDTVAYTPDPGFKGEDSFSFYADDGGVAPSGGASNTATVTISVGDFTRVERQISTGADDGYIPLAGGAQDLNGKWLLFGPYRMAMRFQNISVPQGSRIVGARLKFARDDSRVTERFEGRLSAQATGSAGSFVPDGVYLGTLSKTESYVLWTWEARMACSSVEEGVYWYQSPDMSEIIREIINRSDWSSGNAMVILYEGKTDSSTGSLRAYSYNGGFPPHLSITYAPVSAEQPTAPAQPGVNPPTALDAWKYASANMAVPVNLEATDDGLPEPLSFAILSLPSHGSLCRPDGTPITQPKILAGHSSQVVYVPQAGFVGDDAFTFCADDGGAKPSGGASNTATVTLSVRHMVTREYQVIADDDDAYGADGDPVVFSDTLLVGQYDSAMRFRNVDVPRGSEIISSRLKLCPKTSTSAVAVKGLLYAEAADDVNDFSQPGLRLRDLPRTQESVPWLCLVANNWPQATFCSGPDMGGVLQEIVSQDDWSSGNALAVLYAGDSSTSLNLRFFGCSVPYSNQAAKLEVTYTLAPGVPWVGPPSHPPQAVYATLETAFNQPVTVTLVALDDGLPNPPGRLTYTIESLPGHGTLELPSRGPVTQGQPLPDFGNQVVYCPEPDFTGDDSFTFSADDGGTRQVGGRSNIATIKLTVKPSVIRTVTRTYQVSTREDDASATPGNSWNSVYETTLKVGVRLSGMRFKGVDVPAGAKVTKAVLKIRNSEMTLTYPVAGAIQGEAGGNPGDFSGSERSLNGLPRTTASVAGPWQAGYYLRAWADSPDISPVIQQIIDRPDWSSGNAIVIIFSSEELCLQNVEFMAYDYYDGGDSRYPPTLEITYTPPEGH